MDFLIEPLIDVNNLIVDEEVAAPCCSSGSGCTSGMVENQKNES